LSGEDEVDDDEANGEETGIRMMRSWVATRWMAMTTGSQMARRR
jgi:hypothetical protein